MPYRSHVDAGRRLLGAAALSLFVLVGNAAASVDARKNLGLDATGQTPCTAAVQKALDDGKRDLYFPAGTYLIGRVQVPADTRLTFAPGARVQIRAEGLDKVGFDRGAFRPHQRRAVFILTGDNITVEGLTFDFQGRASRDLLAMFYARQVANVRLRDITLLNPLRGETSLKALREAGKSNKPSRGSPTLMMAYKSSRIEVSGCRGFNLAHMVEAFFCEDVSVHGNRLELAGTLTTFHVGSKSLRHHDNWSRMVTYQCVFRGGSPDPSRKWNRRRFPVPLGSSTIVYRNMPPEHEKFNGHTAGTYDIQITNNYAEYGRTLAWGNRGRQVLFEGNIARYMNDYAYGVEGSANVVFSDNISINSSSSGIMSMYFGSKIVATGNVVIVSDEEPFIQAYSKFDRQKRYCGGFMRLHHGPTNKKDKEAGSIYGAGKVLIADNLCVNTLRGRRPRLKAANGRDVMIKNNKLINGMIWKHGQGSVNITGNEVLSDLPWQHLAIFVGNTKQGGTIIQDNIIRRQPREGEQAPAEQRKRGPRPGLWVKAAAGQNVHVRGNIVEGWDTSIRVTSQAREAPRTRILLADNLTDSDVQIAGAAGIYQFRAEENLDMHSLKPRAVQRVDPDISRK